MRPVELLGAIRHQRSYSGAQSLRTLWTAAFILNVLALVFVLFLIYMPLASLEQNEILHYVAHYALVPVAVAQLFAILICGLFMGAIETAVEKHQLYKLFTLGALSFLTWFPSCFLLIAFFLNLTNATAAGTVEQGGITGANAMGLSFILLFGFYFFMATLFVLYSVLTMVQSFFTQAGERYFSNNVTVQHCTVQDLPALREWYLSAHREKFAQQGLTPQEAWSLLGLTNRTVKQCHVVRVGYDAVAFALTDKRGRTLTALETAHRYREHGMGTALLANFVALGGREVRVEGSNQHGARFVLHRGFMPAPAASPDGARTYHLP